jgi:hypothetical protein
MFSTLLMVGGGHAREKDHQNDLYFLWKDYSTHLCLYWQEYVWYSLFYYSFCVATKNVLCYDLYEFAYLSKNSL